MKNIFKAIAVLAGVAGLAACTKYAEYETAPFASLDFRSATVEESKTAATFTLPVHVYNNDGACSVTYTVDAGTAKEGVDYSLVDASGVLNFAEGTDTQNITISVTGQPGVYTGNVKFTISLKSASNDVQIGAIKTCTVTVKDLDHPLSAMFGAYKISGVTFDEDEEMSYLSWTMNISPVEGDPTKISVDHLTPFSVAYASYVKDMPVIGTVSNDKKTITFAYPQETTADLSAFSLSGPLCFLGHDGSNHIVEEGVVTFTQGEDGAWTTEDGYGFCDMDHAAVYDLFYYYSAVFSTFNSKLPTRFVKK